MSYCYYYVFGCHIMWSTVHVQTKMYSVLPVALCWHQRNCSGVVQDVLAFQAWLCILLTASTIWTSSEFSSWANPVFSLHASLRVHSQKICHLISLSHRLHAANSLKPMLDCFKDIKVWMALHFWNCNSRKTEVLIFGPWCLWWPSLDNDPF